MNEFSIVNQNFPIGYLIIVLSVICSNDDVIWIEEDGAIVALIGADVDCAGKAQVLFAGDFDKAAIACGTATTSADVAVKNGVAISPEDDPSAVTAVQGIGPDGGIAADEGLLGSVQGVLSLEFTADADAAAPVDPRGVDRSAEDGDLVAQEVDLRVLMVDG